MPATQGARDARCKAHVSWAVAEDGAGSSAMKGVGQERFRGGGVPSRRGTQARLRLQTRWPWQDTLGRAIPTLAGPACLSAPGGGETEFWEVVGRVAL